MAVIRGHCSFAKRDDSGDDDGGDAEDGSEGKKGLA